ncbi:PaaI family thioesterase [Halomonas sp. HP20-15]|uniref:PaaI family thioesterase n=1 Tax=Halomonas sp. HP20-15 TaxID=3085901 RepID=UPI0029817FE6|nr:PaaI family thioesterase [Halomonas sp. HP20-15]MDW5375994.1 PaaI family thioesterase [Halomonas sp. HP20-15]
MTERSKEQDAAVLDNPFIDLIGARLSEWTTDRCEWALDIGPQHLNTQGSLHGGIIATLLDVACGYSGFCLATDDSGARAATISLTVHYMAKASQGRLIARGRRTGGGRRIFFATAELMSCDDDTVIATASGSFRLNYPAERGG